jgi:microcystin-dependent protein
MADAYIGEIRNFAGTYAPNNWLFCEGQVLPLAQNTALFSIIGTTYGGNGTSNFAIPDLRGSVPIGQGQGPGLTSRQLGETGGSATVALTATDMPTHTHVANGVAANGTDNSPGGALWSQYSAGGRNPTIAKLYGPAANTTMAPGALATAGGSTPHNNMQPFLPMRFIICTEGIYPPRS